MAAKSKGVTKPKKGKGEHLTVRQTKGEDEALSVARFALRPTVQAGLTVSEYGKVFGDLNLDGVINALAEQTTQTADGDLARAEAMLTTQAHTLDAIFNNLARRAINAEYMDNLEKYLRLGLRAQSQCRATLEALAEMKSPRQTAFVNQANIAHGHQQINNTLQQPSKSAKENEIVKNELLEKTNGERMDVGTAGATGRVDRTVEAVGEVNRT